MHLNYLKGSSNSVHEIGRNWNSQWTKKVWGWNWNWSGRKMWGHAVWRWWQDSWERRTIISCVKNNLSFFPKAPFGSIIWNSKWQSPDSCMIYVKGNMSALIQKEGVLYEHCCTYKQDTPIASVQRVKCRLSYQNNCAYYYWFTNATGSIEIWSKIKRTATKTHVLSYGNWYRSVSFYRIELESNLQYYSVQRIWVESCCKYIVYCFEENISG